MKNSMAFVAVAVVAGGVGFWGGTYHAGAAVPADNTGRQAGGFARGNRGGGAGGFGGGALRQGGGFTAGDVIAKDEKSVTVQTRDGGSKIVFVSATTKIMKSAAGAAADIVVGGRVMVTGATNSDGSVTAESVQVQ